MTALAAAALTAEPSPFERRTWLLPLLCAVVALTRVAAALLLPMRGFGGSPAPVLLQHPAPLPGGVAAEIAADRTAVDQAQNALDAVRAQGSRVRQA